jgi:16S rRNA processing protein RimM
MLTDQDVVIVGRVNSVFGIKGEVKVFSFTDPMDNLLNYQPWLMKSAQGWQPVKVAGARRQGNTLVARLEDEMDRDRARARFVGKELAVPKEQLPALPNDEFYWRDLMGLRVKLEDGRDLGKVRTLLETGANDVLVVKGDKDSLDREERLIPWTPGEHVVEVSIEQGWITVDWDPDF